MALAVVLPAVLGPVSACGSSEADVPTRVASSSYSCTAAARDRLPELRRLVADTVTDLAGRPKPTDYCDSGMDAGVEFHVHGTLAQAEAAISRALGCDRPTRTPGAIGPELVHRCHHGALWFSATLSQYLPVGSQGGPSVLGEASLIEAPAG